MQNEDLHNLTEKPPTGPRKPDMMLQASAADMAESRAAERAARSANSPDLWNRLWAEKGEEEWRVNALRQVYTRVERILPEGANVVDLGGGVGALGRRLRDTKKANVLVVDHSEEALKKAAEEGLETAIADLENEADLQRVVTGRDVVVATEVVEHLSAATRHLLFSTAAKIGKALLSVPNDRLGPDEEPQHTIKYTAMSFKRDLQQHFNDVRIEVLGPYLLGVCGYPKGFTLSVTMPCRDEGADLEATLASFRGVADEIVIGIDPRTVDNTREVAEKYADVIFDLKDPEGPKDDETPDGGVHFGWIRNQCMDRCTGQWIFMTEGHERLISGWETLLSLNNLNQAIKVGFVLRTGHDQQWAFPWLCKNQKDIRYKRKTHNVLDYPDGSYVVQLPTIRTLHDRVHDRELSRAEQRKTQNRLTLLEDWRANRNENSLHYLGTEWREYDPVRARSYMEEYIRLPRKNGAMRYHTRLQLAKLYAQEAEEAAKKGEQAKVKEILAQARETLMGCSGDDWSRTEHWVWLGDLAFNEEKYEEALQFYLYAGTKVGEPPFTLWWVDLSCYSWMPCQRLAMCFGELGRLKDSLYWARKVLELLPDNAAAWAFEEAQANINLLEETIENVRQSE